MSSMAATTGRVSSHPVPPTRTDHENNGARRRVRPGARRVSTVVTTEAVATKRATDTAMRPRT